MRRSTLIASGLVYALCVVESVAGQTPVLQPGTRIRVTLGGAKSTPITGVVDTMSADTIKVRTHPVITSAFALDNVRHLEVSRGTHRPTWSKWAPLWMPLAGIATGAAIGYVTDNHEEDWFGGPEFAAAAAGGLGGILGMIVGVSVAISVKTDEWESVPHTASDKQISDKPSVFLAPGRDGLTFGLRARF